MRKPVTGLGCRGDLGAGTPVAPNLISSQGQHPRVVELVFVEHHMAVDVGRDRQDALTVEGLLEHRIGPPERKPSAKCWRVSSAHDDTDDTRTLFGEPAGSGVVVSSPYRDDTNTTPDTDTATSLSAGVVGAHDTPRDTA